MKSKDYFIITPCKNEEANLPNLINSILGQSLMPNLWMIYDDGSTDGSQDILTNLEDTYPWVQIIHGGECARDLSFHYARIVDNTISKALEVCSKSNQCHYAALIDADMVLENNFFEKLISRFEQNPNLGVASGSVVYDFNDLSTLEKGRNDLPIGGLRMWRVECLKQSKGFPISYSADAVSNVLATLNGWDTRKYDDILGLQSRRTSSAEGMWKGYRVKGESDYFRDYHPLYAFFKFFKYMISPPFYIGIAYMQGYLSSVIEKRDKFDVPEVRFYYRNKYKEVLNYYLNKFTD